MTERVTRSWPIKKYDGKTWRDQEDEIAVEYPLTVMIDGEEFATMVCTPVHLEELVIGFLASEGMIRTTDELSTLTISEQRGYAYAELKNKPSAAMDHHSKRFIGSCCGKSRQFYFHNDVKTAKTVTSKLTVTISQCQQLMSSLQEGSQHFQQTGGVHNAAVCTADGIIAARTDIGRHNALDKLYGYCLQNRLSLGDKIIVVSGRISSEVLLKTAKIGAGILLSKAAPTDLALELAHDLGITTVGFIRGQTCNVYTHPQRILT